MGIHHRGAEQRKVRNEFRFGVKAMVSAVTLSAANGEGRTANLKLRTCLIFPAGALQMVASNATSWNSFHCVGLRGYAM